MRFEGRSTGRDKSLSLVCSYPENFVFTQWQTRREVHLVYLVYRCIYAVFYILFMVYCGSIQILLPGTNLECFLLDYMDWLYFVSFTLTSVQMVWVAAMVLDCYLVKDPDDVSFTYKLYYFLQINSLSFSGATCLFYWSMFAKAMPFNKNYFTIFMNVVNPVLIYVDVMVLAHRTRFLHSLYPITLAFLPIMVHHFYHFALVENSRNCPEKSVFPFEYLTDSQMILIYTLIPFVYIFLFHLFSYVLYEIRTKIYCCLYNRSRKPMIPDDDSDPK